jgi:hypothetical protein
MGPRAGLDKVEERKISCLCGELKHDSSVIQPKSNKYASIIQKPWGMTFILEHIRLLMVNFSTENHLSNEKLHDVLLTCRSPTKFFGILNNDKTIEL